MITKDIPHTEWGTFFHEFSAKHFGWPIAIESLQYDGKDRVLSRDKVLDDEAKTDVAQIELGTSPTGREVMIIPDLESVCLEKTEAGADLGLEIRSKEYGITVIRFRNKYYRDEPSINNRKKARVFNTTSGAFLSMQIQLFGKGKRNWFQTIMFNLKSKMMPH